LYFWNGFGLGEIKLYQGVVAIWGGVGGNSESRMTDLWTGKYTCYYAAGAGSPTDSLILNARQTLFVATSSRASIVLQGHGLSFLAFQS
jgi:hypothetical protein